jgi:glycoprotein-mannosyl O6-kinase
VCIRNASSGGVNPICKPRCSSGEFALPGMKACHPWLTCEDLRNGFEKGEKIGQGAVKDVHFARWKGYPVAASYLKTTVYREDFRHGVRMLKLLQPSLQMVQFVGVCDKSILEDQPGPDNIFVEPMYLTEYHHLGDGAEIETLFDQHMIISLLNNISTRFRMCLDFVRAIAYVHAHSRVMCDSNSVLKMLSQFLLTDDLRLILNDIDALPKVDPVLDEKIICGHREIGGEDNYIAPEQRWPFEDLDFVETLQVPCAYSRCSESNLKIVLQISMYSRPALIEDNFL